MANLILIPHPGGEHKYDCSITSARTLPVPFKSTTLMKKWNTGRHQRKYLFWHGQYIDTNGILKNGDFYFWGEWEPPTLVWKNPKRGQSPNFVHFPITNSSSVAPSALINGGNCQANCGTGGNYQNTDPCVFGSTFKYIICQQNKRVYNKGDVLLFGSTKKDAFLLDTILVIDTVTPYILSPGQLPSIQNFVSAEYQNVTVNRIVGKIGKIKKLNFYRGAKFLNNKTPYSFTPAVLQNGTTPILKSRMTISFSDAVLGKYFKPGYRNAYCSKIRFGNHEWNYLVNLCYQQGFVPAVEIDYP